MQAALEPRQRVPGDGRDLRGHDDEHALVRKAQQIGRLPHRCRVGGPPLEQGLDQRRSILVLAKDQFGPGVPVGGGQFFRGQGVQHPHLRCEVHQFGIRNDPGLVCLRDEGLPDEPEADL